MMEIFPRNQNAKRASKIIKMLALRLLRPSIRRFSTKLPFDDKPLDDEYVEINNFYSEMFTGESSAPIKQQQQDELELLNKEMNDLYGVQPQKRSLLSHIQDHTPKVFVSPHTNPFMNLALEDYIFQHTPKSNGAQRLIFYTNSPCVVIGKNQNPWKECNVPLLESLNIPLVRRKSGGGTVVHDLRNVNYSYITTRESFNRITFGSLIVDCINKSGIATLEQNTRGDILMDGLKVSGSAFKVSKGKSYHHGTMLLGSKLSVLRQLLNVNHREGTVEFRCHGVDSVPAPVANVGITNDEFIDTVTSGFMTKFPEASIVEVDEIPDEVKSIAEELEEWRWRFGATPKFEMLLHHDAFKLTLKVEKGHLRDFTIDGDQNKFAYLRQALDNGDNIPFKGSSIAGFILDEDYSTFIGKYIDGSD